MKKLHWYDTININLFWLGLNIRNNAVGSIFTPYLVALFVSASIRNTALGELGTAGLVIAMLVQPAAGLLSDRSRSRFGRRRPFIFVGVLLDLVFLTMIALSTSYWMLLVAILLQQFSANISHGALQGLIPDLVPEDQRGLVSGIKSIMELLPLIILPLTVARMVGAGNLYGGVAATGGALLVLMLLTMVLVKEKPLPKIAPIAQAVQTTPADPPVETPALEPVKPAMLRVLGMLAGFLAGGVAGLLSGGLVGGIAALIASPMAGAAFARALGFGLGGFIAIIVAVVVGVWSGAYATLSKASIRQASFTWWVVNRLFYLAAITSIRTFAPYFLMYAFGLTIEKAVVVANNLFMVVGIFLLISALAGGWLSDRVGYRRLVGLSGIVAAVGTAVLLTTIWLPNMTLIYVAGIILGLATGLFNTTNWALGTTLVPSSESGRYLGISNLAGAGAGMIGTGIGGYIIDALNAYLPGLGYFIIFGTFGVLFILSTYTMHWIKADQAA